MESFTVETFMECRAGISQPLTSASSRQPIEFEDNCFVTQYAIWTNCQLPVTVTSTVSGYTDVISFTSQQQTHFSLFPSSRMSEISSPGQVTATVDCIVYCALKMTRVLRA